ncbi:MAG: HD domain-containing protein [Desulfobacterales bacterium]|nr:HD domain-containing protein [Desulfobacterales bacterium]
MRINLKRFMSKTDIQSFLSMFTAEMDAHFCIKDTFDTILFSVVEEDSTSSTTPIELQDEIIGWVCGNTPSNTKVIARFLSLLVYNELEKKELGREILEKYREITLLYEVSERLAENLNPSEVAKLIIDEVKKVIQADHISVLLLNEETNCLYSIAVFGIENDLRLTFKADEGLKGEILKSGKAEIVNNLRLDMRYIPGPIRETSLICAPLKIKDRVIGLINASTIDQIQYSAEDLKLLCSIAFQAASAIENARLFDRLKKTFITTIDTLAETIEKRDIYTAGHTRRVMNYSLSIGKVMNLTESDLENLTLAAILHDIGKIGVPDNVLLKNGKLTDTEFEIMKRHATYGEEILNHIENLKEIISAVKSHHERYDGKGYPDKLRGTHINLYSRIIAVADTYDAMTTDRPYRKALSREIALQEIQNNSGTQFDPEIIVAFIKTLHDSL